MTNTVIYYFSEPSYINCNSKNNYSFTSPIRKYFYPVNSKMEILCEIDEGFYLTKIDKNELFNNNKFDIDIIIRITFFDTVGLYSLKSLLDFNKYESIPIDNDKKDRLKRVINRYNNLNKLDDILNESNR